MQLTKIQCKKLEELIPTTRKPAKVSDHRFMHTMIYTIKNGCKWKALPKKYEKCHTVYVKFNKWFQNGTIAKAIAFFL